MFQTTCDCVTVNVLRRTPETRPGRWGTDWAKVPHLSAPSPRQLISPRLRLALISSLCLCVLLWTSPPSGHLCSGPKSNMKSSVWVVVHSVTDWKAVFFYFSHMVLDGLTTTTTTGSAAPTASLCFTHPQHLTCGPWIRIPGLHTCCGWHTHTHVIVLCKLLPVFGVVWSKEFFLSRHKSETRVQLFFCSIKIAVYSECVKEREALQLATKRALQLNKILLFFLLGPKNGIN